MYDPITFNENVMIVYLFPYNLKNASNNLYRVLILTAQTSTESLLNDESAPDGRSYILYKVLTLTAQAYAESLLNDISAPNGFPYNLYRVITLTAQTYKEHS